MKAIVVLLAVAACHRAVPHAECERARDHALVNQQVYLDEVVASTALAQRPGVRAQAAHEQRLLAEHFVPACRAAGASFRGRCFDTTMREQSDDCRPFVVAFYRATLR